MRALILIILEPLIIYGGIPVGAGIGSIPFFLGATPPSEGGGMGSGIWFGLCLIAGVGWCLWVGLQREKTVDVWLKKIAEAMGVDTSDP